MVHWSKIFVLIGSFMAGHAVAQGFPTKPIHLIVGSPPGGIDAYVRLFGPRASEVKNFVELNGAVSVAGSPDALGDARIRPLKSTAIRPDRTG